MDTTNSAKRSIKSKDLQWALACFTAAMEERLAEKEAEGYTGWDGEYPAEKLVREMRRDALVLGVHPKTAKRAIDIANRAMMMWYRATRPEKAE